jgi:hypothetical protein
MHVEAPLNRKIIIQSSIPNKSHVSAVHSAWAQRSTNSTLESATTWNRLYWWEGDEGCNLCRFQIRRFANKSRNFVKIGTHNQIINSRSLINDQLKGNSNERGQTWKSSAREIKTCSSLCFEAKRNGFVHLQIAEQQSKGRKRSQGSKEEESSYRNGGRVSKGETQI